MRADEHTALVAAQEGAILHQETLQVDVEQGAFSAQLGSGTVIDLAVFRDVETTFLGLAVGDDPEMEPRLQLGSVPYAAFAEWAREATMLEGNSSSDFASASHDHDWSELNGVPADLLDGDDDTTYDGTDFALSGQACAVGFHVAGISATGQVTCSPDVDTDTDTTYSGSDFALSDQACNAGFYVAGISATGQVTCSPDIDTDTDTTYSGSDFATSGQSCPAGQHMRGIDANGNVLCDIVPTISSGMIVFFAGACPTPCLTSNCEPVSHSKCLALALIDPRRRQFSETGVERERTESHR